MNYFVGHQSGFTAQIPANGPSAGTISFFSRISNIGNQFNITTGKLTCVYPGMYFFTLSLYQSPGSRFASCDIKHNGAYLINVAANVNSADGYYQASNSVILHLNSGDVIRLEKCTDASTMHHMSSFSGFLVISD